MSKKTKPTRSGDLLSYLEMHILPALRCTGSATGGTLRDLLRAMGRERRFHNDARRLDNLLAMMNIRTYPATAVCRLDEKLQYSWVAPPSSSESPATVGKVSDAFRIDVPEIGIIETDEKGASLLAEDEIFGGNRPSITPLGPRVMVDAIIYSGSMFSGIEIRGPQFILVSEETLPRLRRLTMRSRVPRNRGFFETILNLWAGRSRR